MKKRLDRWKETKYLLTMLSGPSVEDSELSQLITEAQKSSNELEIDIPKFNDVGIVEACKELIFDIEEEKPVFHMILYVFDVKSGLMKLGNALKLLFEGDDTEEEVIKTLAIAAISDIPVYPNTVELTPLLSRLHRKLLIEGFSAPDENGERVRLKLEKSLSLLLDEPLSPHKVDLTESYFPADFALLQEAVTRELDRLETVRSVLASLDYAATELEQSLASKERTKRLCTESA